MRLRARLAATSRVGRRAPALRGRRPRPTKLDDAVHGPVDAITRAPTVVRSGDMLQVDDVKLLYYYQNRTAHIPPEATS